MLIPLYFLKKLLGASARCHACAYSVRRGTVVTRRIDRGFFLLPFVAATNRFLPGSLTHENAFDKTYAKLVFAYYSCDDHRATFQLLQRVHSLASVFTSSNVRVPTKICRISTNAQIGRPEIYGQSPRSGSTRVHVASVEFWPHQYPAPPHLYVITSAHRKKRRRFVQRNRLSRILTAS